MNTIKLHELETLSNTQEIVLLSQENAELCLSIFMPTHIAGSETRQDTIRFSNLVKGARKLAEKKGLQMSIVDAIAERETDIEFWRHQGKGLAILATATDIHFLRLNDEVDERVVVDECFYLKPLIKTVSSGTDFYLLALTWESARLFSGNVESMQLVRTEDLPASIEDEILPPDPEDHIQDKSYQAVGNAISSNTAMYHGQGAGESQVEGDRRNFMSRIAHYVEQEIYQSGRKFVILATETVVSAFRESIHFAIDAEIRESPAKYSDDEVIHYFTGKVRSHLNDARGNKIAEWGDRFGTAIPRNLASDQIDEVVVASMQGRVDLLMMDDSIGVHGTVDAVRQEVKIWEENDGTADLVNGTVDLINRAVVASLRTGAKVACVPREKLPGKGTGLAAIFRF